MNAVPYLLQLKGKPEYQEEYDRLESVLCDADKEELMDKPGPVFMRTAIWHSFATPSRNKFLVVRPDAMKVRIPFEYKLVTWDGTTLTEECGKMYSWDHNPYSEWTGVA